MVVEILFLVSSFFDETKKRLEQQPGRAPRRGERAQRPKNFIGKQLQKFRHLHLAAAVQPEQSREQEQFRH